MRRRVIVLVGLLLALARPVSADTVGSTRQAHENHRCAVLGVALERGGLTDHEAAHLTRRLCKQAPNGSWQSAQVFTQ